jgi:outer membrane protein assembly factor BamB
MSATPLAVVPVLIGPLQVLIALLPAILLSLVAALTSLMLAMLRPKVLWLLAKVLAVAAVALAGVVFLVRSILPAGQPAIAAAAAAVADADWPMFRGGLARRGAGDGPAPTSGGLNWSFMGGGPKYYSSPAFVGGLVYATSADKGPLHDRGAIHCIDAASGSPIWSQAPTGYRATFSSPALAGTYLVCGEGLHDTTSARVVCMDVGAGGRILWTHATKSHVESTPCIAGDRVYVGAGDDGYYCLDLAAGVDGAARVVWHAPGDRFPDAETSPAVHDGLMFAGLGLGGKAVIALDAATGAERWRRETPYPVFGPPTVVDGAVIVGMGNGDFIYSAEELERRELARLRDKGATPDVIAAAEKALGPAGEIWCLDQKTGSVRWTFAAGDTILGAVAAADDRLYFGGRDGRVTCLSLAGEPLGTWNARAPIVTSPAFAAGHLYVVTETGMLYGLRADDMSVVWETRVGFSGRFLSSPTVGGGRVYVGSEENGLLCLGRPGDNRRPPGWDGLLGGPGRGGSIDGQSLPDKGKFSWRYPDAAAEGTAVQIVAPPACLDGRLYVPLTGGRKGLVCLAEVTGDNGQAVGAEAWFAAATNGAVLSPAASGANVFFVDGTSGDAGRAVHCLTAKTGSERWTLPVADAASGALVLAAGGGLVADIPDGLSCFDDDGRVLWRTRPGRVIGMQATEDALVVAACAEPAAVVVLDRPTGAVLWHKPLAAAPATGPVVRDAAILLGTTVGASALRLRDGESIWEATTGRPSGPLALAKTRLLYTSDAGELVSIDVDTGAAAETAISGVPAGIGPLLAPGTVLVASATGLLAAPLAGGEPRSWMKTDWLGRPTCGLVMADSRIYMVTATKGLVCLKSK